MTVKPPGILALFLKFEKSRIPGWVWVVLLWALLVFPAIALRAAHYEEGTVIALARGAVEDGHWLTPYHYGFRFIERPVLLSWIIAALSMISGEVTLWTVRIPHILFLLGGGLLIWRLVRSLASEAAALFAALCFFGSPMIIQKVFTAEPDVMVSVLLFAAFFIWWGGVAIDRTSVWRWIAVGLVLGLAGLTKGPQPLGYFTLGIGAFLVIERRWRDLPGFVLAHLVALVMTLSWYVAVMQPGDLQQWITHSRLNSNFLSGAWFARQWQFVSSCVVEFLPGLLLLVVGWAGLWRVRGERRHQLAFAAMLYAVICTAVLLVWPGSAASRYAMPAAPALATLAGILFDEWKVQKPRLIATALTIGILVAAYGVILGWVAMPLFPDLFQKSRIAAQPILPVRAAAKGPLYVVHETLNNNLLVYVPSLIRDIPQDDLAKLTAPSLAILTPSEVEKLKAARPDLEVTLRAILHEDKISHLIEIR